MTAAGLLTVGHFDQWARVLHALLQARPTVALAPAANIVYSPARLAQGLTRAHGALLAEQGQSRPQRSGIKLQAYYFTSEARIAGATVLACHRGEPFDLDTLPAPLEQAPAPALTQDPPLLRVA